MKAQWVVTRKPSSSFAAASSNAPSQTRADPPRLRGLMLEEVEIGRFLALGDDASERSRLAPGYPAGVGRCGRVQAGRDLEYEARVEAYLARLLSDEIDLELRPVKHLARAAHVQHVDLIVNRDHNPHRRSLWRHAVSAHRISTVNGCADAAVASAIGNSPALADEGPFPSRPSRV